MKKVFVILLPMLLIAAAIGLSGCKKEEAPWEDWLYYRPNGGIGGYVEHFTSKTQFPYRIRGPKRGADAWRVYAPNGEEDIILAREGYTFKCWNTFADGSGISFYPGERVSLAALEELQLYAIWEKIPEEAANEN